MRKMRGKIGIIVCLLLSVLLVFAACADKTENRPDGDKNGAAGITTPDDTNTPDDKEKEEPKILSASALAEALATTAYTSNIRGEEVYGLTDPSSVGVDEKAMQTVKYPAPSDADCIVFAASDYNVTAGSVDNSGAFGTLVNALRGVAGTKKVKLESGTYRFSRTVNLSNLTDVYFCGGEDTRFVMTQWVTTLNISNCSNLHVNDIAIDYDPSPNIAGTIESVDTAQKRVVIRPDEEFDLRLGVYGGGNFTQGSYLEYEYDELTKAYKPKADGNLKYNDMITYKKYDADSNTLTLGFDSMAKVEAGTGVAVAFTMYNNPAVSTQDSSDIYFENTDVICAPGMAFYNVSDRNMFFNRSDVRLDPDSSRRMTASADGIHCKDATGNLQITGCLLEASHDDSINICNFYKTVVSASGNTIVCNGTPGFDFPLTRNSTVDIYRPNDYGFAASFKVTKVAQSGLTYTLTVDGDASEVRAGYLVGNATRVPRVRIENNIFRNKRNRGILAQFRNSRICNNAFINVLHGPVMMHSVWDDFHEAIVPRDIEVRGNKFIGNNAASGLNGDVYVFVYGKEYQTVSGTITGITVADNFFTDTIYCGVYMRGVGQSEVKNNFFYDVATRGGSDRTSSVSLRTTDTVTVTDNYTLFSGPRKENYVFLYEAETAQITAENNPVHTK